MKAGCRVGSISLTGSARRRVPSACCSPARTSASWWYVSEPRLPPLPVAQWDDELRGLMGANPINIFGTLAYHPKLAKRWMVFGAHVLAKNSVPARDRE